MGCMTVALTFSIMEGMEYAIFTKLENISFPGKITNNIAPQIEELEEYLMHNDIFYQRGFEEQVLLMKGSDFRIVTIHGIEKFLYFKQKVLNPKIKREKENLSSSGLYLGKSLSLKLDISIGDTVIIGLPNHV